MKTDDILVLSLDDLDKEIATTIGGEGFFPAERCPLGHDQRMYLGIGGVAYSPIGSLCKECAAELGIDPRNDDPLFHPEIRIQRGKPRPFSRFIAEILPVAEEFAKEKGLDFYLLSQRRFLNSEQWASMFFTPPQPDSDEEQVEAETAAEALARSFLIAVKTYE